MYVYTDEDIPNKIVTGGRSEENREDRKAVESKGRESNVEDILGTELIATMECLIGLYRRRKIHMLVSRDEIKVFRTGDKKERQEGVRG